MNKRKYKRHKKRLEVRFREDGTEVSRGYMGDISEQGAFIRCRHPLPTGATLDITADLPNGVRARMRAMVRRSIRGAHSTSRSTSGMGLELVAYDLPFAHYLRTVVGDLEGPDLSMYSHTLKEVVEDEEAADPAASAGAGAAGEAGGAGVAGPDNKEQAPESVVLKCPSCGARNRVPKARLTSSPKCGRCKMFLVVGS